MRSIQWSAQVERFTLSSSSRKACHAAKYVVMQHTSSMGSCGRTEIERKRITIFSGCAFRFLDVTSVDIGQLPGSSPPDLNLNSTQRNLLWISWEERSWVELMRIDWIMMMEQIRLIRWSIKGNESLLGVVSLLGLAKSVGIWSWPKVH